MLYLYILNIPCIQLTTHQLSIRHNIVIADYYSLVTTNDASRSTYIYIINKPEYCRSGKEEKCVSISPCIMHIYMCT